MRPGVSWSEEGAGVSVWAPRASTIDLVSPGGSPIASLTPGDRGWFAAVDVPLRPGDRYLFSLDGRATRPDPASLSQPDGVHGPSQAVDLAFDWSDQDWTNPDLADHIFYELHVGTFTPTGTFDGVAEKIPHLIDLGVTAIELMPVASFPGTRNWGYDGVHPYAVQDSYGGAAGLARLVDACHDAGLAVYLDVVYNHLGPEGNYLRDFGPYFTDRYKTPWGEAINFDGPRSDEVRSYFIENALMWISDFHIDGLRLDAVHAIFDSSARPFLRQLAGAVHQHAGERRVHVVAESSANDPQLVRSPAIGGQGLDAAWNDDFHHALHVTLTGEHARYYADFIDGVADLTTGVDSGYVDAGRYSEYRGRTHGAASGDLNRSSLVVFAQNHDQIGNRAHGDRLSTLVDRDRLRFAAAITLLTPWVPMLFMGEEWAETRPFLYFTDHGDAELSQAVTEGRAREFAGFIAPGDQVADPSQRSTFDASVLDWGKPGRSGHSDMLDLHRRLIELRSNQPAIRNPDPKTHLVTRDGALLSIDHGDGLVLVLLNAGDVPVDAPLPGGSWVRLLDGSDGAPGPPGAAGQESGTIRLPAWGFAVFGAVSP